MVLRLWLQARRVYQAFVTGNDAELGPQLTKLLNLVNIVLKRRRANVESRESTFTSNQETTDGLNLKQTATYTVEEKPLKPRSRLYIDPDKKT